jgi:hydroxyacylglutathione hydrolase
VYFVIDERTNEAAIVDPSEPDPVVAAIEREGVRPVAILATHHHPDHVGGNDALVTRYDLPVYGHESDKARIPRLSKLVAEGDTVRVAGLSFEVLHIPGHTLGAIAYVGGDGKTKVAFTGDTLFVAGCGRMFEGTPPMMQGSLAKLAALDGATQIYCGHEYTESNLRFAASVEPKNAAIAKAAEEAAATRAAGKPTVPSTIAREKATNPFFRWAEPAVRAHFGLAPEASAPDVFAATRKAKDHFR